MEFCATLISNLCFLPGGSFLAYFFIFVGMFLQEEIFLLASGSLAYFRILDLSWVFVASFLGTLACDTTWFLLGRKYGDRIIKKFKGRFWTTEKNVDKIKKHLKNNGGKFVFVSKFLYGFNRAFLVVIGASGFSFKKFIKYDLVTSLFLVSVFLFLGKVFAYGLESFEHDLKIIKIGFILLIVIVFLVERFLRGQFLRKFLGNGK